MPELDNLIYDRQKTIGLYIPDIACIIGCGGTGFWTAIFLAMSGVSEIVLIDKDVIDPTNLNRLPIKMTEVNKKKTNSLRRMILSIRPNIRIEIHDMWIEEPEDCDILRGTIFCCTDNLKSQQLICAYCKRNDLKYQRIGYDGTILNVSRTFPLSFKTVTNEGGYTITPSWVIPAALSASLGVSSQLFKQLCVMDDISKLCIKKCSSIPQSIIDEIEENSRKDERDNILDNIGEYIPDDYGYCPDCDRGNCDSCEERYTNEQIASIITKAKAEAEGRMKLIKEIKSGEVNIEDL